MPGRLGLSFTLGLGNYILDNRTQPNPMGFRLLKAKIARKDLLGLQSDLKHFKLLAHGIRDSA